MGILPVNLIEQDAPKFDEEQRRAGVPPVEAIAGTETDPINFSLPHKKESCILFNLHS
jgi:hypothetical protein